ncbi:hypothetical protein GGF32_008517 [Allomyces javanicus]|nr:hypothetical protein GGF32_008517 [Allomyces javanicus]
MDPPPDPPPGARSGSATTTTTTTTTAMHRAKHWTLHTAAADANHAARAAEPGPGSAPPPVPLVGGGPVVPSPTRTIAPATPAFAAANGVIPPDTPTTAAAARHLARVPLLTRDWLHRMIPLGFTNALLVVGARVAHVTVRRSGVVPAVAPPIPMSVSDAIVAMIAHAETAGTTATHDADAPPADRILGTHTQPLRPGHTVAATVAVKPSNLSAKYATRAAHLGIALAPTKYEIEVVVSRVVHSGPPRPLPLPLGAVVELPAAPTDPARASRKRLRPHAMNGESVVVGPAPPPSLTAAALGPPPPRPRLEPADDEDEGPVPPPPRKRSKHRHDSTMVAEPALPPPVPPLPPWCHDTLRVVAVIRRVLETPVPLDVPHWSDEDEAQAPQDA